MIQTSSPRRVIAIAAAALLIASCAPLHSGPYTPQDQLSRDPALAGRLAREAADVLHADPAHAEHLLREALSADLYCGEAHNNLGVVYLKQGRLYDAAGEFEWSRKLLPGLPDPRMNLAITLERAGRTAEAIETYRTALEVYPGHIQTLQALTRLQVRTGRTDGATGDGLREIAFRGDSDAWKRWARARLAAQ